MRRLFARAAILLVLGACTAAANGGSAIEVSWRPATIRAATLNGLRPHAAGVLSSGHPQFGGFSGLLMERGRATVVSDRGWLLDLHFDEAPEGWRPGAADLRRLPIEGNQRSKNFWDAEGLARTADGLAISFERFHRIVRLDRNGAVSVIETGDPLVRAGLLDAAARSSSGNRGLEALATLPDGRLLAIGEDRVEDKAPMLILGPDGVTVSALPLPSEHSVTGADIGPDGRLYVVFRNYTPLVGVSVRVRRYRLGAEGFPDPASMVELGAWEGGGGVDNMEGIALWTDAEGRTRLTLVADDNFSLIQRTLVMDFIVE